MAISRKTFKALAAGLTLACMATAPALAQTVTQPTLEKIKTSGKVVLGAVSYTHLTLPTKRIV